MEISDTVKLVHQNAREKGFWDKERNVGEMLMLVNCELSEAMDAHRAGKFGYEEKGTFEEEIADCLLRLFDLCGGLNIDIERELKWKMEYNKNRERLHGKNY